MSTQKNISTKLNEYPFIANKLGYEPADLSKFMWMSEDKVVELKSLTDSFNDIAVDNFIIYCVDEAPVKPIGDSWTYCYTREQTIRAMDNYEEYILTNDLSSMSFNLLYLGYRIFLSYKGKAVELYPGMQVNSIRLNQFTNILLLLNSGTFNKLLDIPDKIFSEKLNRL